MGSPKGQLADCLAGHLFREECAAGKRWLMLKVLVFLAFSALKHPSDVHCTLVNSPKWN